MGCLQKIDPGASCEGIFVAIRLKMVPQPISYRFFYEATIIISSRFIFEATGRKRHRMHSMIRRCDSSILILFWSESPDL